MDGYLVHGGMGMARGSTARIDDGKGILVYVWQGELWITQEGDRRDYFVGPGRWFRIERDGAALLTAMSETHATLTAPTPNNYARRIVLAASTAAPERVVYDGARERRSWLQSLAYRFRFLEKKHSFQ